MTYLTKGTIDVRDYWAFLDNLNNVWGAGSGSNGYGQTSLANTLVSTTKITAAQWSTLISRLDTVRNHQRGSTSGISAPSAGTTISFSATLRDQINDIVSNRFSTNNTRGTARPTALGNPIMHNATVWTSTATKEFNVTFANNDAARWFFNSGGLVTFYGNVIGNTGAKSGEWYNILNTTLGTVSIGGNVTTRSGTGGDTGIWTGGPIVANAGFSNLTSSYSTLLQVGSTTTTADYGQNYVTVEGRTVANGIGIRVTLTDAASDLFGSTVNGNVHIYSGFTPPETTFLANTWGAPSGSTVTNTQS